METEYFALLRLICAHIVADFFLQPKAWIVDRKKRGFRSAYLYYHIAIVGMLTYLFLANWTEWQLPLFIAATHFLIDWLKSTRNDTVVIFSIDQIAHLVVIVIGWSWLIDSAASLKFIIPNYLFTVNLWIVLTIYLISLRPAGFLIGKLVSRWQNELTHDSSERTGLKDAGTWIGYMERLIIITFILLNQFGAIGFLIAAKSIFRFKGGVKDRQERKHAEYIIIGTLISFFMAILLGMSASYLLKTVQ